jgi:NitT/TauT family transport system ATP-binding protein
MSGPPRDTLLDIQFLTKIYFPDGKEPLTALKDLNFSVYNGEFLSLVGPSGCGKSTFIKLTCGLLPPTSGQILLNGDPITEPIKDVGIAFQAPILLEWRTVIENVLLPIEILERKVRSHHREHATRLLRLVGLTGFEDAYPGELSGGMQQRVSICRALVHNPYFLLMDEPFGALDSMTRDKMNKELLKIWEQAQKTIIFITHNIREAVFLSDRVVVLTARPGTVRDIVTIDAPRPRDPAGAVVRAIERQIHDLIGEDPGNGDR